MILSVSASPRAAVERPQLLLDSHEGVRGCRTPRPGRRGNSAATPSPVLSGIRKAERFVGWRELNRSLVLGCGRLGDISTMFTTVKGKRHFTRLDLASGFHTIPVVDANRHKTAFGDSQGQLFEFARKGRVRSHGLPAAFTQFVKRV